MGSDISNSTFCYNIGIEKSEGAGTFVFFENVTDRKARQKLIVVYVRMQGEILLILKPLFKDGCFVVYLDQFLFKLYDGM